MRRPLCLIPLFAFCMPSRAQEPTAAPDAKTLPEVEKLLASTVPAEVAWGGYLAQRHRLRDAVRALGAALQRWRDRDDKQARFVRLHLVDGLVGCGAHVASEQVEFLLADALTREAAFVVIAAEPAVNMDALARLAMEPAEPGDLVRQAAARLLIHEDLHVPALAAYLVQHASSSFDVTVRSDVSADAGWNSAIGLGGRQAAQLKSPPGFPPLVRHGLAKRARKGAEDTIVAAAAGVAGMQHTRTEPGSFYAFEATRRPFTEAPPNSTVFELLGCMAGEAAEPAVAHTLIWRDAPTFLAACTKLRNEQRNRLDALVARLRAQKWLAADELPGLRITLEESVHDERTDRSVTLPPIPPVEPLGK
ncbi:MAG TPA: hypothetical protein VFZ65_21210 [Planctomycetota bacterium]|nr:hypothetical protein [Planctomycetota bacterium]